MADVPADDLPPLVVPEGAVDVLCKFCNRSKFTTPNATLSPQYAIPLGQRTLRWRRERGNVCSSCFNFQSRKSTKAKFKAAAVLWPSSSQHFQILNLQSQGKTSFVSISHELSTLYPYVHHCSSHLSQSRGKRNMKLRHYH